MKNKYLIISGFILIIILIIFTLLRPQTKLAPDIPSVTPSVTVQPTTTANPTLQTPNDQIYSQAIKALVEQYPWYSKIPVETKDFRIIYDFDKNSFRIRLLTQSTETIKQTAINELKSLGVDLAKFTYYFIEP